ncbi:hypothetical protein BHE74_00013565 [Ensete ventricosum]|nr:hypothetical protein BHE74_00013565 [Ensete ventricosum]
MAIPMHLAGFFPGLVVSSGVRATVGPRPSLAIRCGGGEGDSLEADFDKKAFRHNLTRSENYNRRGFGHKKETLELMNQQYTSKMRFCWNANWRDVIKTLKENNNEYTWGDVTVKLAQAYGFCWGVERAVQIGYEARKQFPEERIWITNEIIHNPMVNKVWDDKSENLVPRFELEYGILHSFSVDIVYLEEFLMLYINLLVFSTGPSIWKE